MERWKPRIIIACAAALLAVVVLTSGSQAQSAGCEERVLCVLSDVTLPRLSGEWAGVEANGSGPPPNLVALSCGVLLPGETPYVPEFVEVVPGEESPDETPLHTTIEVSFGVSEVGTFFAYNRLTQSDYVFSTLTVKARSE